MKTTDGFGNGRGFLRCFNKLKRKQIHEIMVHPRYNSNGQLIDTMDFEENEGTPCEDVIRLIQGEKDIILGTYSDFLK